jgi:hypothetical protein
MKFIALSFLLIAPSFCAAAEFGPDYASQAVALSLHCATQESPHYEEGGKEKVKDMHPAFYGCFDWHSSVHGHWAMLRALRAFPDLKEKAKILEVLEKHFTKENLEKEKAFFEKEPRFERTYGWAWFLRLVEEVGESKLPQSGDWKEALAPLENTLVAALKDFLGKMNLPIRMGMHSNTAYTLMHVWDYATYKKDDALLGLVRSKAKEFFAQDKNCPLAYEPSSGDFISPCFTEADLMRRVLGPKEFKTWLEKFLPKVSAEQLKPVLPLDDKDYILVHLLGLTFEKAAALRGIASALPAKDPRRLKFEKAAASQAETGWKRMFSSGYGGTHWIASFAIFYYDRAGI